MRRFQAKRTFVQTNDVYFAVTMLTLYVADIQTTQPATLSLKRTQHTVARRTHSHQGTRKTERKGTREKIRESWTC